MIINQIVKGSGGGGASAAGILLFGEAVSDGTLTTSAQMTKSCVLSGVKKVAFGSLYNEFSFGGNQYVFDTSGFTFSAPDLEEIEGNGMARMFNNTAQAMTSFSMPKLKTLASSALELTFAGSQYGTNLLTEADLSSVETIAIGGLASTFRGQTALQKVYLTGVSSIHSGALGTSSSNYAFRYCDALTEIHFPAAMQATIEAMSGYADKWGATNATIYFD